MVSETGDFSQGKARGGQGKSFANPGWATHWDKENPFRLRDNH